MILCLFFVFALAGFCPLTQFEDPKWIIYDEVGFPGSELAESLGVPERHFRVSTPEDLIEALELPHALLVWRHGPYFPMECWEAFLGFLNRGGSWIHLADEPMTRPVVGDRGSRVALPRMVTWLKVLGLNQSFRFDASLATQSFIETEIDLENEVVPDQTRVFAFEPRLSETKDFQDEDGSPGSRDAIVRPLSHLTFPGGDPRFPDAAGSVIYDRLRGPFSGGRWVIRTLSSVPSSDEQSKLLEVVQRDPVDFRMDPTLGCFYPGERPSVLLRVHRPGALTLDTLRVELAMTFPNGLRKELNSIEMKLGVHGVQRAELPLAKEPGLYRIHGCVAETGHSFQTGFWIYDESLFESGDTITFDTYTMRRNGKPSPVVGTTVMSETVHRKFLFEPNAAQWDSTFEELSSIGVDLVRTGVWSGYRKISLDPHVVDEAFIRSLQAYYLSARSHGVAVLFTFFAFVPESFGGENPYWDPRSREGQKGYITSIVTRFKDAKEILWDLINEPSYSSPEKLWLCRPNGDGFEAKAFLGWLEDRYGHSYGGARGDSMNWEDRVRARWRLVEGSAIGLPSDDDFLDAHVFSKKRPYRAKEFIHFAQDAFVDWVSSMSQSIREAGASQSITVGQDEGGLFDRPSPLMHHSHVDYTSLHSWWFNDRLHWDGAMAKAPLKPLLVSETGVMNREGLSGEPMRDPEESADLLGKKIAYAFGGRAFGVIQWCYEVNPYMDSDNEVAIGLKRVDGSYKPEHRVFRKYSRFVAAHRSKFESPGEPEIVMILPAGDHYSPRGLQGEGTYHSLRTLMETFGYPVQVVNEYRVDQDLGSPKLIVLPACRGLSEAAWVSILGAVTQGAHLFCSGFFETDDAGLPAQRMGVERRPLSLLEIADNGTILRFERDVVESWYAADLPMQLHTKEHGQGQIHHFPVPSEWAANPKLENVYGQVLTRAGLEESPPPFPLGIVAQKLGAAGLKGWILVNESSQPIEVNLPGAAMEPMTIRPSGTMMAWVEHDGTVSWIAP